MGASGQWPPDWRSPLPTVVAALVALAPEAGTVPAVEEGRALEQVRTALALADAELRRRYAALARWRAPAFDALPPILVQSVLAYLRPRTAAGCVSTTWRDAVASLRRGRRLSGSVLPPEQKMSASEFVALLRQVPVRFARLLSDVRLPIGVRLGVRAAPAIPQLCRNLRVLSIGYHCPSVHCTSEALREVLKGLRGLRCLHLGVHGVGAAMPWDLLEFMRKGGSLAGLRELGWETSNLDKAGPQYWDDRSLAELASLCPNLQGLAIDYEGSDYAWERDTVFGPGLRAVVEGCGGLEKLHLGLMARIGLGFFRALAERLEAGASGLRSLSVFGAVALESPAGEALQARLEALLQRAAGHSRPRPIVYTEEEYRKLLRGLSVGRSSIFVPSLEYLISVGIDVGDP